MIKKGLIEKLEIKEERSWESSWAKLNKNLTKEGLLFLVIPNEWALRDWSTGFLPRVSRKSSNWEHTKCGLKKRKEMYWKWNWE